MGFVNRQRTKTIELKIITTTDIHGAFFPKGISKGKNARSSLAKMSSYIKRQRSVYGDRLFLFDAGDVLQGQPANYMSNFIDNDVHNIASEVQNYLMYDAVAIGNHDIETGHAVYDKWQRELNCPVLGANVIETVSGTPYFAPYTMIERAGVKIAVLGMVTPAIPHWLSEDTYSGLKFEDVVASANKWLELIKENETPDLVVGLFHTGLEGGIITENYRENAALQVAKEVHGIDILLFGHDHSSYLNTVEGMIMVNASANVRRVGEITVTLRKKNDEVLEKKICPRIHPIEEEEDDVEYLQHFEWFTNRLTEYTSKEIGRVGCDISTMDCYFGPSAYSSLMHEVQLLITGADISFNAPLLFNSTVNKGITTMADMFALHKFEDRLCVLKMTGREVHNHLEMSYSLWTNQMHSLDDHILQLIETPSGSNRFLFQHFLYNFDSASGIDYEVDVTKPQGQKVQILRMSDGKPFEEDRWYKVVMSSYRANGGGELLTKGAGIDTSELSGRLVFRTKYDARHYLTEYIKESKEITPQPSRNWRFVPPEWTEGAIQRDRALLFPAKTNE